MNLARLPSTRLFRFDCRKDFYDILQLPKGASESQIKRSYRKLALQYHPVCSSTSCIFYFCYIYSVAFRFLIVSSHVSMTWGALPLA